jgi:hypothetical protein
MRGQLAVIRFIDASGRPVDPGFGVDEGAGIDNGLPGPGRPGFGGPVDPGFGVPLPPVINRPVDPGYGVDEGAGIDNGLPPTYPVKPGNDLPRPPGGFPRPPLGIWPPQQPIYPSHPIYPTEGDGVDNSLPLPPGSVWPPLPPDIKGKILAFCWLVGIGYRWVVLDPSQKPGFPVDPGFGNPGSERPDQGLPPDKQPKR